MQVSLLLVANSRRRQRNATGPRAALRQAHELPVVIAPTEVRRRYARMLIDRDRPRDREKARELLTEAIAMYRQIGMPKHVEVAEALLGEL